MDHNHANTEIKRALFFWSQNPESKRNGHSTPAIKNAVFERGIQPVHNKGQAAFFLSLHPRFRDAVAHQQLLVHVKTLAKADHEERRVGG